MALAVSVCPQAGADPVLSAASPAVAGEFRSVTLLTGDRVLVAADRSARADPVVLPGAGRERVGFSTDIENGHVYVVPGDAMRLVATDRVDRRLFDVTALVEFGYDDASRGSLPLIVTYEGAARMNAVGGAVTHELPSINGAAISVEKGKAADVWNSVTVETAAARGIAGGVRKVWLDGKRTTSLDRSAAQIGAPAAWAAGVTGAGVTIAVLDTGVDQTHPDLAGQEIAERNFTGSPDTVDRFGHGTHVASIAAGTGAKSGGRYQGVAHGAKILDGKVLNDAGFGFSSNIIAGMQWAAEQGAKIVSASIGGPDGPELDPVEEAVNTLSAQHGMLFVIAAGNDDDPETINSPGSADAALTVGAVRRDERIAEFSSRGPRIGDGAIKPDITAPGVGIVAAKAASGIIGLPVEDGYVELSGTSMATPHVTGAAALLAQQHPTWNGAQLKAALTASARPNPGLTVFDQGSGRVDVAKAITQSLSSEPTNVSLGALAWPHDDDQPVTRPVTYHNLGSSEVTLTLTVDAKGPDGLPAPSGVFTVSPNEIRVPAGGQAQAAVTGDTRAVAQDGHYTGTILATAGESSVSTPVAINREPESYNLTLNVLGPDGPVPSVFGHTIIGHDDGLVRRPHEPDGSVTIRLPKSRYFVDTLIRTIPPRGEDPRFYRLTAPNLSLTGDLTLDVDARLAQPVSVTVPDPSARSALIDVGLQLRTTRGQALFNLTAPDINRVLTAQLGPAAPAETLTTRVHTQLTAPDGALYGLAWFQHGTVPTGFTKVLGPKDLATVRAELGSVVPNRTGALSVAPVQPDGSLLAPSIQVAVPLPSVHTAFLNSGVSWETRLLQSDPSGRVVEASFQSAHRTFTAGHTHDVPFNRAPFGPAFPKADFPWAVRAGDTFSIRVPLFGDSSGNAGTSVVEAATTQLFRNGELVSVKPSPGSGVFDVPAEEADYRLTTEAVRPGIFDVTTKISAAWSFRSGRPTGPGAVPLPLSAIRFTPKLDDANAGPAGRSFVVPVALQLLSGATVRPHQLSVEVSYDEGATWRRAKVFANLAVLLHHPGDADSVSLRATATDRDGNTVEQTITRAYKLAE